MGCDIHGWVEIKKKDGKWIGYEPMKEPALRRNYELFADLAGVRGESKRDNSPLGIPCDVSETVQLHINRWAGDSHSHSYMGLREADEIFSEYASDMVKERVLVDPLWHFFGVDEEDTSKYFEEYRIVFWFDN